MNVPYPPTRTHGEFVPGMTSQTREQPHYQQQVYRNVPRAVVKLAMYMPESTSIMIACSVALTVWSGITFRATQFPVEHMKCIVIISDRLSPGRYFQAITADVMIRVGT